MPSTQIELDKHETWVLARFMADNEMGDKRKAIPKLIREFGRLKKYKRSG